MGLVALCSKAEASSLFTGPFPLARDQCVDIHAARAERLLSVASIKAPAEGGRFDLPTWLSFIHVNTELGDKIYQ